MNELNVAIKTVTPLFLGGANPNEYAELRPPALKGVVRFWYRALDPDYESHEGNLFGGAGLEGQSPCTIRLLESITGKAYWDAERYKLKIEEGGFKASQFQNGIMYLGYSLNLGDNQRKAIPAGTKINLCLMVSPSRDSEPLRRAWAASLWLVGTLGGLGSRCRRGIGTAALVSWSGWPEASLLPSPHIENSSDLWLSSLERGLKTLRAWYPNRPPPDHSVLDKDCRIFLVNQPQDSWEEALNKAGCLLQDFRYEKGPDYNDVKSHLAKKVSAAIPGVSPHFLTTAPERTAFGLPLEFRYGRPLGAIKFVGTEHERMASRLWIRIVHIHDSYYPLFFSMNSPFLDSTEQVKDEKDRDSKHPFSKPGGGIIDDFLNTKIRPISLREVRP